MKFEIGSQWKTRGGWRAVVVDEDVHDGLYIWHNTMDNNDPGSNTVIIHGWDGMSLNDFCPYLQNKNKFEFGERQYDLIEPWKEPVVHEGFLPVYVGDICESIEDVKKRFANPMSIISVCTTEGEGL